MCVCLYVCMYICMYICIYIIMLVCMYVCMYVCMHACMYKCMYISRYISMYKYVCMYNMCAYLYLSICLSQPLSAYLLACLFIFFLHVPRFSSYLISFPLRLALTVSEFLSTFNSSKSTIPSLLLYQVQSLFFSVSLFQFSLSSFHPYPPSTHTRAHTFSLSRNTFSRRFFFNLIKPFWLEK